MEIQFKSSYFVYIMTNQDRTHFKAGITTNLHGLIRDVAGAISPKFITDFKYLVYYERYSEPIKAVDREARLSGFSQKKLRKLIIALNPELVIVDKPEETQHN